MNWISFHGDLLELAFSLCRFVIHIKTNNEVIRDSESEMRLCKFAYCSIAN